VIIPYKETKGSGEVYRVDFEVVADSKQLAIEKALKRFDGFLDYNLASWVRTPIKNEIEVEFIEKVKDIDPWSYL